VSLHGSPLVGPRRRLSATVRRARPGRWSGRVRAPVPPCCGTALRRSTRAGGCGRGDEESRLWTARDATT